MDYLALKIPADIKQKITAHTVKAQLPPEEGGGYPFEGEHGAYELCGTNMIQIVPAAYEDIRRKHYLDGALYCDDEGLMNGKERNWRASQMRYWYMWQIQDQLTDDWRDWTNIVGDACFVVPATDENLKIMEDILDS